MTLKLKTFLIGLFCTGLLPVLFGCSGSGDKEIIPETQPDVKSSPFMTAEDWDVVSNGFGSVSFDPVTGIILEPKAATDPAETHASLLLSKFTEQSPLANFKITIKASTDQQLRTPAPNPWECFWIFFNYTTGSNGKKVTNYFAFKTNGIELGTAYDEAGQTFLATSGTPTLQIGVSNEMSLTKQGQQLQVSIDGKIVMTYDGSGLPLIDTKGSIGLYTEDAKVHISSILIQPL